MHCEPVVDLGVDANVGVVTTIEVVVRVLHHTLLVQVTQADVVVRTALVTGNGDVVGHGGGGLAHIVIIRIVGTDTDLAAGTIHIPVTTIGHGRVGIQLAVTVLFFPCHGGVVTGTVDEPEGTHGVVAARTLGGLYPVVESLDVGHLILLGHALESHVARIGDVYVIGFLCTLLGGDQDNTESSLSTIDGSGGGIFQDGDGLYVVGVHEVQGRDLYVIQQDERSGGTFDGTTLATDTEDGVGTHFRGTYTHIQTGGHTLETTCNVRNRTSFKGLVYVHGSNGTGQVDLLLSAVTHDDRFGQEFSIVFQNNADIVSGSHLNGSIADAGNLKGSAGTDGNGENTLCVGHSTGSRSLDDDTGTRNGSPLSVNNSTGDPGLLLIGHYLRRGRGSIRETGSKHKEQGRACSKKLCHFHRKTTFS